MAQVTLAALQQKVADQGVALTAVEAAVARLQAAIAANNPAEIQAQVDALDALVGANNARLVTLAESVPPDTPPNP